MKITKSRKPDSKEFILGAPERPLSEISIQSLISGSQIKLWAMNELNTTNQVRCM